MKTKYLERLNNLADKQGFSTSGKTLQRKVDYIRHNLGEYISKPAKGNVTVLEVGPGLGELVQYLNGLKIYSIDVIDNDQSILKSINSKYKIRRAIFSNDIINQKKFLGTYDLVVMIQVLEHIPISKQKEVIKTLFQHLNRAGQILIVVPNANNPLGVVERYADYQHTIAFTEPSLTDLVHNSILGKFELKIKGFEIPPYGAINPLRIILQKILHLILLCLLIINGGVFFKIMTPNIMVVITKK